MFATITRRYKRSGKRRLLIGVVGLGLVSILITLVRDELVETRVATVAPRRVIRGAWQPPRQLRRIIHRERIRTVMTLTAINRDDPKYTGQETVVQGEGVGWLIVPMRGSTATPEQMAMAADLAMDPGRQPVFFHCVAGHHRSNLVQAAIRIRHQGWTAAEAWAELASLPWTRPGADPDIEDRAVIERFSRIQSAIPRVSPNQVRELTHATSRQAGDPMDLSRADAAGHPGGALDRLD